MRSASRSRSIAANDAGSASASAVGIERSSTSAPSSSAHTSMLIVPGSMPTASTRDAVCGRLLLLHDLFRHVLDRFRIENEVVAREQPPDALLVQLHLEISDAERAERDRAFARGAVLVHLDTFDAERGHGVEIDDDLELPSPRGAGNEHHTCLARVEEHLVALDRGRGLRRIAQRQRMHRSAEAIADLLGHALTVLRLA